MRVSIPLFAMAILLSVDPSCVLAADGALDPTFASGAGKARYAFDLGTTDANQGDHPTLLAIQSDGLPLVIGTVDSGLGTLVIGMLRTLPSGLPDPSFNGDGDSNGRLTFGFLESVTPRGVALQPDGKFVIAMRSDSGLVYLNRRASNGDRADFPGSSGQFGFVPFTITGAQTIDFAALQALPSGKFLAAGTYYINQLSGNDFFVARFNSDGTLDSSFGSSAGFTRIAFNLDGARNDQARDLAVAADGRIAVVGTVSAFDNEFGVAVLQANGLPDSGFSSDGKAVVDFDQGIVSNDRGTAACFAPNGDLLVGGIVTQSIVGDDVGLALLNSSGDPPDTFGANGRSVYSLADTTRLNDVACAADGTFALIGTADTSAANLAPTEAFVAWFLADGTTDPRFGSVGAVLVGINTTGASGGRDDQGVALALTRDARAYAAVDAQFANADYDFGLARVTASKLFANGFD